MEEKKRERTDLDSTQFFSILPEQQSSVQKILSVVYEALSEKGYDPVNQIVGYIMSGDPTYVTNYKGARSLIMKVERDELVEEIMRSYIQANHWND
ncbi:MAG: IreB family regulatory phosphoprotein [Eubacteriales bacterium]|nr:IreB family regulatory phosphoprotein [Eubacteriales bacterium]